MLIKAQPQHLEIAAPRTKYDMIVFVVVGIAISTVAGFLSASFFSI